MSLVKHLQWIPSQTKIKRRSLYCGSLLELPPRTHFKEISIIYDLMEFYGRNIWIMGLSEALLRGINTFEGEESLKWFCLSCQYVFTIKGRDLLPRLKLTWLNHPNHSSLPGPQALLVFCDQRTNKALLGLGRYPCKHIQFVYAFQISYTSRHTQKKKKRI